MKGTPQNKQNAKYYRADWYARNVQCVLEPIHTVWRPLDGTTAFDTEERICGACWLVEDDRGAGRGDHGQYMLEDESELRRLKRNEYQRQWYHKKRMAIKRSEFRRLKRNEYHRQWYHKKRMAIKRALSASVVLPPRSSLEGVVSATPDSTESQVEDTEDPWELQRMHGAWLAKELFYDKKKKYFYGLR